MVNFALSTSVVFALVSVANAAPTLEARDASCNEQLGSSFFAIASDAVWCINYLASLGDQACVSNVSGVAFCRHGTVQITGLSRKVNVQATSSCANVARAAGQIMDSCTVTTPSGQWVMGSNPAWGNGDLLVDIRDPTGH